MAKAVISYDKDLPAIEDRRPWEPPSSHLVKAEEQPTGWLEKPGRRASQLLLVPKIRDQVDAWRDSGYKGATEVTQRLFEYWFEEDHIVAGFESPFRYHFCQREAIETLVWLVEIANPPNAEALIREYGTFHNPSLTEQGAKFQNTMDGKKRIRRYIPERKDYGVQDLPPEDLSRYAFKMATGSGKTWVIAMTVVWSRFHRQLIPDSKLSTNFLIVAPNVIVYQRLEKDFADNRIFHELPLVPPEWKINFSQKVILRGESTEPGPAGNLFLTNIHQLYESRDQEWTATNAVEAILGRPVVALETSDQRSMLERVKSLKDLVVFNDEAHHVHNEELAWSRSLLSIHQTLPKGVALWLDFSATPKDQQGMFFPWTVCDYPLAQAVEDRIVKAPIIVDNVDPNTYEPDKVTKTDVVEKYGPWLRAAVKRWKEHHQTYDSLKVRPVLFIMAERNAYADALGEALYSNPEFGFSKSEVLVIHTDNKTGEVRKGDLEKARQAARDIDESTNKIKIIVSVMMLREGWDVRNVTVVLGLRPFTAKAEILPEQVIGRGLRLMTQVSPDRTQTLEVLGTPKLLDVIRAQLETEGVSVTSTKTPPALPVIIEPTQERMEFDIKIPITKGNLDHNWRNLANLDPNSLQSILENEDLDEVHRLRLKMEFATTETEVQQADIALDATTSTREILSSITNKIAKKVGLSSRFSELYPKVRAYVKERCFGRTVNLDDDNTRSHLSRSELQEAISNYLATQIGNLTVEPRRIEFERLDYRLSETSPFSWRRDLPPPMEARKTIFNFVATYNPFERKFAEFLDQAEDVLRFAALGTTEQGGSGTAFRVNYLKPSGAIGLYHPDWVVVQKTEESEINWIIETKGRVWEDTERKDKAMQDWCHRVSTATGNPWKYIRVNQTEFRPELGSLRSLVVAIVSNEMFTERDHRETTMSVEEILDARDEGRA